jgi:hypothetical protein
MTKTKIRDLFMYNTNQLVLIDEEYGYKQWLWLPNFPLEQLPEFWKSFQKINLKSPTSSLPGVVVNIDFPARPRAQKFWNKLYSQPHFFLHIWNDSHSYLLTPDKQKIYHAAKTKG